MFNCVVNAPCIEWREKWFRRMTRGALSTRLNDVASRGPLGWRRQLLFLVLTEAAPLAIAVGDGGR